MAWTKDQEKAIYECGQNIIVSAGAGSGKTAVLSERILEKVKSGVSIDSLLVLTFTEAAAFEMKERIKKKVKDNPSTTHLASDVDSAYITTFDSYALSIVKKYHYLLGIDKNMDNDERAEATYFACLKILSEALGKLPLKLLRKTKRVHCTLFVL